MGEVEILLLYGQGFAREMISQNLNAMKEFHHLFWRGQSDARVV